MFQLFWYVKGFQCMQLRAVVKNPNAEETYLQTWITTGSFPTHKLPNPLNTV